MRGVAALIVIDCSLTRLEMKLIVLKSCDVLFSTTVVNVLSCSQPRDAPAPDAMRGCPITSRAAIVIADISWSSPPTEVIDSYQSTSYSHVLYAEGSQCCKTS